jgi:outer membrane protein assembly factor BamD (BamD/ComL family)
MRQVKTLALLIALFPTTSFAQDFVEMIHKNNTQVARLEAQISKIEF